MKRVFALLLALCLIPALAACGEREAGTEEKTGPFTVPVTVTVAAELDEKGAVRYDDFGQPLLLEKVQVLAVGEGRGETVLEALRDFAAKDGGEFQFDETTGRFSRFRGIGEQGGFWWCLFLDGKNVPGNTPLREGASVEIRFGQ